MSFEMVIVGCVVGWALIGLVVTEVNIRYLSDRDAMAEALVQSSTMGFVDSMLGAPGPYEDFYRAEKRRFRSLGAIRGEMWFPAMLLGPVGAVVILGGWLMDRSK